MKKISVLGATGSVGINTLKIIAYNKNKYNSEKFVKENPHWKMSLQTHKILGFP